MFFCNNCGAKIENDNAKFCPNCGKQFPINGKNENKKNDAEPDKVKESLVPQEKKQKQKIGTVKKDDNGKKKGNGLLIAVIVFLVIIIASAGTLFYLYHIGKLKNIEHRIFKALHIKKPKSSIKNKSGKKPKSKNKKTKKTAKANNSSNTAVSSNVPAPTYVYRKKSYLRQVNAFSAFKYSFSSSKAYLTGVSPLNNSSQGNAPAVIISNVIVSNASAFPSSSITLYSKFYAEVPSNFTGQRVKLSYQISGNGFSAFNTSYVNVTKPGIYGVALSFTVPNGFPADTYSYTLTVTSSATIEESPAGFLKVE
jgi:hypothetical protein